MHHEPSGSCPPVHQARSKRCPACQQAKPLSDFAATSLSPSCRDCRRVVSRLASRRRAAAMWLLIAAHPKEWAGLLGLVQGRRHVPRRAESSYQTLPAKVQGGGGNAA
jgi:uncharacterized protein (DUF983 family)